MPAQAIENWLSLLEREAAARGIEVTTDLDEDKFHFKIESQSRQGVIGKVRRSTASNRSATDPSGNPYMWQRFDPEIEYTERESAYNVCSIQLDLYSDNGFDATEDHFIFFPQELLLEETVGDNSLKVYMVRPGVYRNPFDEYADDWDQLFEYAHLEGQPEPDDNRRMTTDRFYGGVDERLSLLLELLGKIKASNSGLSTDEIHEWVVETIEAESRNTLRIYLSFLKAIGVLAESDNQWTLTGQGKEYVKTKDNFQFYHHLRSNVKGFDTIVLAFKDKPQTDEDLMRILTSTFEKCNMGTSGVAGRHRGWLQALGFVKKTTDENAYQLTEKGHQLAEEVQASPYRDNPNNTSTNSTKTGYGETRIQNDSTDIMTQTAKDLLTRIPFDEPKLGKRFTQDALERWFDTKFGYQISGINPRRDNSGNRYILLFSQETGPYADEIGGTEFQYIGEGMPEKGDQNQDSPGNSVLIDAITDAVPIFFFYKGENKSAWEYRGLVDVLDWGWQTNHDAQRQEIMFSMRLITDETTKYTDDPPTSGDTFSDLDSDLYLIPISKEWFPKFERTVASALSLELVADVPEPLRTADADRIWGTTATDSAKKRTHAEEIAAGDLLLFYHDGKFIAQGVVGETFISDAVGEFIWGNADSKYIFTVEQFSTETPPIQRVWNELGYDGQPVVTGFQRVANHRLSQFSNDTISQLT